VSPRDSAKLLIYNRATSQVVHDIFLNLPKYLPPRAVLVFNETKVIPARFIVTKPKVKNQGGGVCTLLYLAKVADNRGLGNLIRVLSDKKLAIGSVLKGKGGLSVSVVDRKDAEYILKTLVRNFDRWLDAHGIAPLPQYIKYSPLTRAQAKREYQTIFAKKAGSVAAPTASLHFTKRLLKKLQASGFQIEFVTLHVGLGTFAKVTEENLKQNKLHKEHYEISRATAVRLKRAKREGRPVIAVGTTVARTLEHLALRRAQGELELQGKTDLFIQPGYKFKFVDGLITNFHVPKSSLLMLVSAMTDRKKILRIYEEAIKRNYKLFSFGDGMLIL